MEVALEREMINSSILYVLILYTLTPMHTLAVSGAKLKVLV